MAITHVAEVTPAMVKPEEPTQEPEYTVIGTGRIRPDGTDKVIGRALALPGVMAVVTMGRAEVFEGTGPTSGTDMWVRMGVRKNGRLTFKELGGG